METSMPSFDVVSEVDRHEITNAADQTNREVSNRFDFKGSDARVEQAGQVLTVHADNEFQLRQVIDILHMRIAKRGIDIAALAEGEVLSSGNKVRLEITVRQGIDQDTARQLVTQIKAGKLRVQTSIQGDKLRVSGKKRDDLQNVISNLKESSTDLPLQYINFRD